MRRPFIRLPCGYSFHEIAPGFAQKQFPISLEEDGKNIRGRNITSPAPRSERSGPISFFCPHFSVIAFLLKTFELRLLSGSYFCVSPWKNPIPLYCLPPRTPFFRFLNVFTGMKCDVWSVIIGLANPKGIESCSPGLRGTSYPG